MAYIKNKGNGIWRGFISKGSDPGGKRIRMTKTFYTDPNRTFNAQEQDIQKQVTQWEADVLRGVITTSGKITFRQLADEWMEDFKRGAPSPVSIKRNRDMLDSRILTRLGRSYVQDLKPADITKFLSFLASEAPKTKRGKGKTISGTYQKKYFTLLKAILQRAVSWGYITVNPAAAVTSPRLDTPEIKPYTPEDSVKLLEALEKEPSKMWRAYFTLAFYTQMRRGELIGLDWAHVDLKAAELKVQQAAYYIPGQGTQLKSTKTAASKRTIKLSEVAVSCLESWRKEQTLKRIQLGSNWIDSGAVFTQWDGSRTGMDSPACKFRKLLKENGLPPISPHGLRHTGATLLIAQGTDVQTVRQRLGHARASTTMDIYAHAFKDRDDLATAAFDQAIQEARKEAK